MVDAASLQSTEGIDCRVLIEPFYRMPVRDTRYGVMFSLSVSRIQFFPMIALVKKAAPVPVFQPFIIRA